ncbi:uncharacterized protein A4U43_C08F15540 [Asparagus officinalis]|nr:uncharacterized protein A4U43_C08F15540 [Asparagus officinalis]
MGASGGEEGGAWRRRGWFMRFGAAGEADGEGWSRGVAGRRGEVGWRQWPRRRAHSPADLLSLLARAESSSLLGSAKLVVVDSIVALFRSEFGSSAGT